MNPAHHLRRHSLALLMLGLMVWLMQATLQWQVASVESRSAATSTQISLTQLGLADLCTSHGGTSLPGQPLPGQASHDCCLSCISFTGSLGLAHVPPVAHVLATTSFLSLVWHPAPVGARTTYRTPPSRAPPVA